MGITISDWLMMVSVIAGPILAVQIQKSLESRRQDTAKKLQVFKDLMSTRAATLAFQHVSALNMVGIEFHGNKNKKVVNAWIAYLDQLNSYPNEKPELEPIWIEKKNDLLSDLLYEMGVSLGFEFDKTHIKKAGYLPKAYVDQELEQNFIRKGMVDVFLGEKSIPMSVESFPVDTAEIEAQRTLRQMMQEHFEGKRPIKVEIVAQNPANQ